MKILSIETSCDETAVAVLNINGPVEKPEIKILGNALLSQAKLHEKYGGVYPNLAKREHEKNLPPLLELALKEAGYKLTDDKQLTTNDLDYIAVTSGPGLEPALWVGIKFAEELGRKWNKPVIPVNHMEGHIFSVLYHGEEFPIHNLQFTKLELPALALLVSGGHTELVHVKDFGNYEILGRTRDDAVGEAFDKVARMLGLPYPGGPEISRLAKEAREAGRVDEIKFPRPMMHSHDLDFSYSGLKTAVLYKLKDHGSIDQRYKEDIARAFEDAAVEVLTAKTRLAIESLEGEIKTVIVAGGVAASQYLQQEISRLLEEFPGIRLMIPLRSLATDNAVMIGIAAYIKIKSGLETLDKKKIIAEGNLSLAI